MAFSLVYRNNAPSEVTGPISFLLDTATVLFAPAVTRWGMLVAIIEAYFLIRLAFVVVNALINGEWEWHLMYK